MKPRIRIRFGIWSCGLLCEWVRGYGYTPAQAYEAWHQEIRGSSRPLTRAA